MTGEGVSTTRGLGRDTAVVLERIEQLREDVCELRRGINDLLLDYQRFRETYVGEHVKVVESSAAAHKRLDQLMDWQRQIEEWREVTQSALRGLELQARIVAFVGSALGVAVIGLLISILTHQVSFP